MMKQLLDVYPVKTYTDIHMHAQHAGLGNAVPTPQPPILILDFHCAVWTSQTNFLLVLLEYKIVKRHSRN